MLAEAVSFSWGVLMDLAMQNAEILLVKYPSKCEYTKSLFPQFGVNDWRCLVQVHSVGDMHLGAGFWPRPLRPFQLRHKPLFPLPSDRPSVDASYLEAHRWMTLTRGRRQESADDLVPWPCANTLNRSLACLACRAVAVSFEPRPQ